MAHATYPAVFFDEAAGFFKCEMRDKKTGRIWGYGYGVTRQEAIYNARHDQPSEGRIKRAIGWVSRHPFIAGAALGAYLAFRQTRRHGLKKGSPLGYLGAGAVVGAIAWGVAKIAKGIKQAFR